MNTILKRHPVRLTTITLLLMMLPCCVFAKETQKGDAGQASAEPKSDFEKFSYTLGSELVKRFLNKQDVKVDTDWLLRGVKDTLLEVKPLIPQAEQDAIMKSFLDRIAAEAKVRRDELQKKMKAKRAPDAGRVQSKDASWKTKLKKPELMTFDATKDYFWVLETSKGMIKVKLMPDVAPMHVTSTIFLTQKGFYDDLKFHRVITNFMAQGGCPLGTGSGGPGYKYAGEFDAKVKHDRPYLLSMANAGPNTDGSQFFITFVPTPHLDGRHTIFGEVAEGQDVVKKLEASGSRSGQTKELLTIKKATIEAKAK